MTGPSSIITIDGPSGSGKSTISRLLATKLGYTYLDTGAMYRAVGLKAIQTNTDPRDEAALHRLLFDLDITLVPDGEETRVYLDGRDVTLAIRTPEMSMIASEISARPLVREKLTVLQRELAKKGRVVAEGRDMGTVVFPDARHKFYLDATPEERANRRYKQLQDKGIMTDYQDLLAQIIKRDHDDSTRDHAPLKPAPDAVKIDSSHMDINGVIAFIFNRIHDTLDKRG